MSTLLRRLADLVARFEIRSSTPLINNGLRGFEHLEVSVQVAAPEPVHG
jgi:hypothetical protein